MKTVILINQGHPNLWKNENNKNYFLMSNYAILPKKDQKYYLLVDDLEKYIYNWCNAD